MGLVASMGDQTNDHRVRLIATAHVIVWEARTGWEVRTWGGGKKDQARSDQ